MAISEDEANAQLETLQQKLTRNLQEIDKNFAECNRVISSKTIAEVERYTEATSQIWNHSKVWLYFFKSMDQRDDLQQMQDNEQGTNRPPHHDLTLHSADRSTASWSQNLKHDVTIHNITELGSLNPIRMSLKQPASITSQDSTSGGNNPLHKRYNTATTNFSSTTPGRTPKNAMAGPSNIMRAPAMSSVSSISTTPSSFHSHRSGNKRDHQGGLIGSPPRIIPFATSPRSLIHTPIREAARIVTDNVFQAAGIRSSEDDDSSLELTGEPPKDKGKRPVDQPWDATNIMETDDLESRARFDSFLKGRQNSRVEEFPSWAGWVKSPSNRSMRHQTPLASTPTTDRVLNQKQMRIAFPTDTTMEDIQALQEETNSSLQLKSPGFILPSTPYQQDNEEDQEEIGAYEFSDTLQKQDDDRDRFSNYQARERHSPLTEDLTLGSGSNITMVSGHTGQIPARFDLNYFPRRFREPPASSQLVRIYNFFAERPGAMLTIKDFLSYANNNEYNETMAHFLVNVLVSKKFLKKVGDKEAWTIRR